MGTDVNVVHAIARHCGEIDPPDIVAHIFRLLNRDRTAAGDRQKNVLRREAGLVDRIAEGDVNIPQRVAEHPARPMPRNGQRQLAFVRDNVAVGVGAGPADNVTFVGDLVIIAIRAGAALQIARIRDPVAVAIVALQIALVRIVVSVAIRAGAGAQIACIGNPVVVTIVTRQIELVRNTVAVAVRTCPPGNVALVRDAVAVAIVVRQIALVSNAVIVAIRAGALRDIALVENPVFVAIPFIAARNPNPHLICKDRPKTRPAGVWIVAELHLQGRRRRRRLPTQDHTAAPLDGHHPIHSFDLDDSNAIGGQSIASRSPTGFPDIGDLLPVRTRPYVVVSPSGNRRAASAKHRDRRMLHGRRQFRNP